MGFAFVKSDEGIKMLTKGAAERISSSCSSIIDETGGVKPIDQLDHQKLDSEIQFLANKALRSIGFAYKLLVGVSEENLE